MNREQALENFYMVKEAFIPSPIDPFGLIPATLIGMGGGALLKRLKKGKQITPVQAPKSEIIGKGKFKSRRMGKGKAALLYGAGGLLSAYAGDRAYKKYKQNRKKGR